MTPVPHNQHGIIPLGGWIAATFVCVVGFLLLMALTLSNRLGLSEVVLCVGIPLLVAGYVLVTAALKGPIVALAHVLLWGSLVYLGIIVAIVASTSRVSNSCRQCSSQSAARS